MHAILGFIAFIWISVSTLNWFCGVATKRQSERLDKIVARNRQIRQKAAKRQRRLLASARLRRFNASLLLSPQAAAYRNARLDACYRKKHKTAMMCCAVLCLLEIVLSTNFVLSNTCIGAIPWLAIVIWVTAEWIVRPTRITNALSRV